MVRKNGLTVHSIEDVINQDKSMDMGLINGRMETNMRGLGLSTTFVVLEYSTGKMVVNIVVVGLTIKCMGRAYTFGVTVENTRVNSRTICVRVSAL